MTTTTPIPRLPRVQFKPVFSIGGLFSGVMGGVGLLLSLQQFSVAAPTQNLAILLVGGGALLGLLGGNIGRFYAVGKMNRQLSRVDQRIAAVGLAPAEVAPAPATAATVASPVVATAAVEDDDEYGYADEDDDAGAAAWVATHVVPAAGMAAWSEPDNTGPPVTQLEGGVQLRVLARENGLAQIEAYNGWTAWVESRRLRRVQS